MSDKDSPTRKLKTSVSASLENCSKCKIKVGKNKDIINCSKCGVVCHLHCFNLTEEVVTKNKNLFFFCDDCAANWKKEDEVDKMNQKMCQLTETIQVMSTKIQLMDVNLQAVNKAVGSAVNEAGRQIGSAIAPIVSEVSTYASKLKQSLGTGMKSEEKSVLFAQTKQAVEEVIKETDTRQRKQLNVIVFGLKENPSTTDKKLFLSLMNDHLNVNVAPDSYMRLGKSNETADKAASSRPLLIKFKTVGDRNQLLRNCYKLKNYTT